MTHNLNPGKPAIGILMLDSQFPRIPGDIGNPVTWPFPVLYKTVTGATPDQVVRKDAKGLLEVFIEAGQELVDQGAVGITTSCGFLSLFQTELSNALSVPVLTSSLMKVATVNRMLPQNKRAGILTIAASNLTHEHLKAAQVPDGTPVETTEGGREFTRVILNDEAELNVGLARQDNIEAAMRLKEQYADLGAIVLECTNMAPYAVDIAAATNLPVYSIENFVSWFYSGLVPRSFV